MKTNDLITGPEDDRPCCGQIFEDADRNLCSCEIALAPATDAEISARMTTVAPFPIRHSGPCRGSLVDSCGRE